MRHFIGERLHLNRYFKAYTTDSVLPKIKKTGCQTDNLFTPTGSITIIYRYGRKRIIFELVRSRHLLQELRLEHVW